MSIKYLINTDKYIWKKPNYEDIWCILNREQHLIKTNIFAGNSNIKLYTSKFLVFSRKQFSYRSTPPTNNVAIQLVAKYYWTWITETSKSSIDNFWVCCIFKGHSITAWTRWGGRGSKTVCFCPCSGYKNCPRRPGGVSKKGKILSTKLLNAPLHHGASEEDGKN